jgi:hypothetical protein
MPENKESFLNLVNASGFLFQLRIEREIKAMGPHGTGKWEIAAREYRWFDLKEESDGFIDLVLKAGIMRMVIECKRVIDAHWIFLVPDGRKEMARTRVRWTLRNPDNASVADWHDFHVSSRSPEAAFCIVRGQGEKDTPMLERLSSLVLRSVECLADEELLYTGRSDESPCIYFPVIITNAILHVCRFESENIDISNGQIDNADFEQVPCVRLRKSFSSPMPYSKPQQDIEKTNQANECTILIIHSGDLATTLNEWDLPYQSNAPWPWEGCRRMSH